MEREKEIAQGKADDTIRIIFQSQPSLLHTIHASADSADKLATFVSTLRDKLTAMYLPKR